MECAVIETPPRRAPALCEGGTRKCYRVGTVRTASPEESLQRFMPLMPELGITRLANVTHLDRVGLPVFVSVRPNSRSLSTAQGKGATLAAAKVSALMESVECWHAERPGGTYKLESPQCLSAVRTTVDLRQLPLVRGAKIDAERPIHWYAGVSLTTGEEIWVPAECVSLNMVAAAGTQRRFERSSNGLASGNSYSEAILHGLFEVIERDAWSLWNLRSDRERQRRRVDLAQAASASPLMKSTLETLRERGIVPLAWEMTSDINVPAYHCMLVEDPSSVHWRPVPTSMGSGAHLSPEIALLRAVNEAIQCRATMISGNRDDRYPDAYRQTCDKRIHGRLIEHFAGGESGSGIAERLEEGEFIEDDIAEVVAALSERGLSQIIVADLGKPNLGVPVVKVIVPGLEGFHEAGLEHGARARRLLSDTVVE